MSHTDYLEKAFEIDRILSEIPMAVPLYDVDAFVGTGLSGTLVVPVLAHVYHKRFGIVRKEGVPNHSWHKVESNMWETDRWLFVDDCVCSGRTEQHVMQAMTAEGYTFCIGRYLYMYHTFSYR